LQFAGNLDPETQQKIAWAGFSRRNSLRNETGNFLAGIWEIRDPEIRVEKIGLGFRSGLDFKVLDLHSSSGSLHSGSPRAGLPIGRMNSHFSSPERDPFPLGGTGLEDVEQAEVSRHSQGETPEERGGM
jgi:hypothetical protein